MILSEQILLVWFFLIDKSSGSLLHCSKNLTTVFQCNFPKMTKTLGRGFQVETKKCFWSKGFFSRQGFMVFGFLVRKLMGNGCMKFSKFWYPCTLNPSYFYAVLEKHKSHGRSLALFQLKAVNNFFQIRRKQFRVERGQKTWEMNPYLFLFSIPSNLSNNTSQGASAIMFTSEVFLCFRVCLA